MTKIFLDYHLGTIEDDGNPKMLSFHVNKKTTNNLAGLMRDNWNRILYNLSVRIAEQDSNNSCLSQTEE